MNAENTEWLIWSNEHNAWWSPASMGYSTLIQEAGKYSFEEAVKIVRHANKYCNPDKPNETMVPL